MGIRAFVAALASIVWLAACGGGGGGGTSSPLPTPNRAPSANAGQDYTGSIQPGGVQVGSDLSRDPDGDPLTYLWTIVSQPEGADAELDDETAPQPKLLTPVPGTYELEVAVSDPAGATGYDRVSVALENDAPVPAADVSLLLPAIGENIELTAVRTADPNGQPLTYTWTLETAPVGVTAGTTYDGVAQTISFDTEGEYGFSLTVSDGYDTVAVDLPVIFASKFSIRKLPKDFGRRALQPGGDRLVVDLRDHIGVFDEGVIEPKLIPIPHNVLGVAVSPDGRIAALEGDGAMSFVDLDTAEFIATWPLGFSPGHFVVSDEGIAYITSVDGGGTDLVSVNMTTGRVKTTAGRYPDLRGYLHPSGNKLYVMPAISPNVLGRYTISGGDFSDYRESATSNGLCGSGWMKGDGSALMAYCGRIMQLSDNPATDMTPIGWIQNLGGVQSATYSPITKYWYVLGVPNEEFQSKILVYDSRSYELIHTFELPLEHGSSGNQLVGRFITASQTDLSLRILATDHPTANVDFYMLVTALDYPAGVNLPPEVTLQKYSAGYVGEQVSLDASDSIDPEGLPLTYDWEILSEPNSGAAILTDANSPVVRIFPSLVGEYVVQLTVSDGVHQVVRQVTVSVSLDHSAAFYRLPGNILDAEYSKSLSVLAYLVEGESSLHIVDLLTFREEIIPLERQAYRIGMSPDGLQAALSHAGLASLVDLQTATVSDSVPTAWDWGDIALGQNGRAHMNTERGDTGPLVTIDFGIDQDSLKYSIYLGMVLRMHPVESWLYGATTRQVPAQIRKWDTTSLPAQPLKAEVVGSVTDDVGGNIWISEDGDRMLSATGKVFTISSIYAEDLLLDTTIPDGIIAAWADHSSETGEWAVIVENSTGLPSLNGKIVFYDDQTFARKSVAGLRDVPIGDALFPVLGARIFHSDDGTGQVILTSNLGATADPFTVQVLNLSK